MATSLMLRDERNQIVGYVLMMEDRLLCRVNAAPQSAELVALSEDMQRKVFFLPGGGQEHAADYAGRELLAAYVRCGGELIASTGEQARAAYFAEADRERTTEEKSGAICKKEAGCAVYTEGENGGASGEPAQRKSPQARWPPPPCWPLARYVDGVWTEEGG